MRYAIIHYALADVMLAPMYKALVEIEDSEKVKTFYELIHYVRFSRVLAYTGPIGPIFKANPGEKAQGYEAADECFEVDSDIEAKLYFELGG